MWQQFLLFDKQQRLLIFPNVQIMIGKLFWEIPSSFDMETLLKNHPPDFRWKIDHFYYIIDYLSRGMDLEDLDDNGGYINVNAKKLQREIHNYKDYLDYLLNCKVIRTDKKYVVGKKSFGYRISRNSYHKATVTKIPVKDLIACRHKLAEIEERKKKLNQTKKQYPHLTNWFDLLQIDREGAIAETERLYPELTGAIRGTRKGKASRWEKRYKAIAAIDKIANKEFYYSVDENVGRFHSNLTNLKKELRNYLTYNGQKLVNIDIKNSQPLFSTILFYQDFYKENSQFINIYNIPSSHTILSNTKHPFSSSTIMVVKALERINNHDINKYTEMVNSGEFYQQVSKLMYPFAKFDKKKIKTMVFVVFFSKNIYMGQDRALPKREFKALFPSTYEIFKLLKRRNHTALAHILQRIESIIMIQNVTIRIARERPDLPIFTIHDSVVTTVGNDDYVAGVIQEEAFRLTGLTVKLGKEYLEPQIPPIE